MTAPFERTTRRALERPDPGTDMIPIRSIPPPFHLLRGAPAPAPNPAARLEVDSLDDCGRRIHRWRGTLYSTRTGLALDRGTVRIGPGRDTELVVDFRD